MPLLADTANSLLSYLPSTVSLSFPLKKLLIFPLRKVKYQFFVSTPQNV